MGQRAAGWRGLGAALVVACLVGIGIGALWQPRSASAETVRQLSWFLDAMHVKDAHRLSKGERVTVAVVDTGVDSDHPDLRGRVLSGTELGDDATADPEADGREDTDGHGTGMASLIAGAGAGGTNSLLGVAPAAKILPVRIPQTSDGSFQPADVYAGVRWAIDHGAKIVNMSFGGERSTEAPWKKRLVDYAISKDVVLIAAAGNTGQGDRRVAEPASIPGVVAVSGVTRAGRFWRGSAKGPEVVVSAPAEELPMAAPNRVSDSGYVLADGTSGATALVSGVAALIRSAFPEISANDVINRLIHTVEDRGPAGRDEEYGFGVVDALAALEGSVNAVDHHPLVSPEAAALDDTAVAGLADRRIRYGVLLAVGVFVGTVLVLLVAVCLLYLARRSRQIVVAGMTPGVAVGQVPGGAVWGPPPGAPWPANAHWPASPPMPVQGPAVPSGQPWPPDYQVPPSVPAQRGPVGYPVAQYGRAGQQLGKAGWPEQNPHVTGHGQPHHSPSWQPHPRTFRPGVSPAPSAADSPPPG